MKTIQSKGMKRSFALFVAIVVALTLWTATPAYATEVAYGECGANGNNLTWSLDDDGVLTISGSGDMADYNELSSPWYSNRKTITRVDIESNVTSIGRFAFDACEKLTSVNIPAGVTSIGGYAFDDCSNLTSITIPAGVISIGNRAFFGCSSLKEISVDFNNTNYDSDSGVLLNKSKTNLIVCPGGKAGSYTIPNSVMSITENAFAFCKSLTSITIPSGVTEIGKFTFSDCSSLTSITIPPGVTEIGGGAFSHCSSLISITFPDSLTEIGSSAFLSCHEVS